MIFPRFGISVHSRRTMAISIAILVVAMGAWGCSPNNGDGATSEGDSSPSPSSAKDPSNTPSEKALVATDPPRDQVPEGAIWFVEARTGLNDFVHVTGARGDYRYPEIVGSGCVLFDYDNDGDLDAYMVQAGDWPDSSPRQDTIDRLYRNEGGGHFVDVTEASGLVNGEYGCGACAADYDGDGFVDLWVNNFGRSRLYRNLGDGTFEDVSNRAGIDHRLWACSACWLDYDLDGDMDLYVANYVDYSHDKNEECGTIAQGSRDYCAPKTFNGLPDSLYRNNGDGTFNDVSEETGILAAQTPEALKSGGKGLGALATDVNGDGWPDIYVPNDQVPNFLYINDGQGKFQEDAFMRGCALSGTGSAEASMGIASADTDLDGDLDLFMTHLDFESNTMYLNDGDGFFDDVSAKNGMEEASMGVVGFGTELFDYDNDGDDDAIVANGHVLINIREARGKLHSFPQKQVLVQNDGQGQFVNVSEQSGPFFQKALVGRGLAVGDVDLDGDLDVLFNLHGFHEKKGAEGRGTLLLNIGAERSQSVILDLRGDGETTNRLAIGARVRITCGDKTQTKEVHAGSSFASQSDSRLHFGLGSHETISKIEIRWPNKERQEETLENIEAGALLTIRQGQGVVDRKPFER